MSIPNTGPRSVRPTHPAVFLKDHFMAEFGLTVSGLAEAIGVSRQSVNDLLLERRSVSPAMALRLSRLFANTPDFWLTAQRAVDLWDEERRIADDLARIRPLKAA